MTARLAAAISVSATLVPAALAALPHLVVSPGPFHGRAVMEFVEPDSVLLGAGDGHVVAVHHERGDGTSELIEIGVGRSPRRIATLDGGLAQPSVGTDADGRTVVVVRACAPETTGGNAKRTCPLARFDLSTGRRSELAGSAGALLGDLDHGRSVLVFGPADIRVGRAGGGPVSMPATQAVERASGGSAGRIESVDLSGGVLAITASAGTETTSVSLVLAARIGEPWRALGQSGTGGAAQGPRDYHATQVTPSGVVAHLDGAGDAPSYAVRWGPDGSERRRVMARAVGAPSFVASAAIAGNVLVTAASSGCDEACGVTAAGPLGLG